MSGITPAQRDTLLSRCREDPGFFFAKVLGCTPWQRQLEIAESIRDNRVTCVPSCHSSGKSWIAGRVALWFLFCFPRSVVITTAPTDRQVRGILWKEILSAHRAARFPLGGKPTTQRLEIDPDWYAWGFTAPDWDPNRFQGFHADHILVVRDEACGITSAIAEQIDSLMAGGHARDMQIGNPVDPFSAFKLACDDPDTKTLPISVFDTPNFTHFGIEQEHIEKGTWEGMVGACEMPQPSLVTPVYASMVFRRYGKDSPVYQARVLGIFPEEVEGAYYGAEMRAAEEDGRIGNVPIDPRLPCYTGWDLGHDDKTAIWWVQRNGPELRWINYFEDSGHGLAYYARIVKEFAEKHDLSYEKHYAPHDINVTELGSGNTRLQTASDLGLHFTPIPRLGLDDGIQAVRNILPRSWFDLGRAKRGVNGLKCYRHEEDPKTGEMRPVPLHDWASHPADAARTFANGMSAAPTTRDTGRDEVAEFRSQMAGSVV